MNYNFGVSFHKGPKTSRLIFELPVITLLSLILLKWSMLFLIGVGVSLFIPGSISAAIKIKNRDSLTKFHNSFLGLRVLSSEDCVTFDLGFLVKTIELKLNKFWREKLVYSYIYCNDADNKPLLPRETLVVTSLHITDFITYNGHMLHVLIKSCHYRRFNYFESTYIELDFYSELKGQYTKREIPGIYKFKTYKDYLEGLNKLKNN